MNKQNYKFLDKPIKELPFVVLDLETTGFDPISSGITEIAIISTENGEEELFDTLVNPEMQIPRKITQITGISDQMVCDKPVIGEIIPIVDTILQNSIFVSHNVPFDWSFLDYFTRKHLGKPLEMPSLCTLRLSRKYLGLRSNKLGDVAKHFKLSLDNAHRAMCDTQAAKGILFGMLDILEKKGFKTGNDLLKSGLIFPTRPPSR